MGSFEASKIKSVNRNRLSYVGDTVLIAACQKKLQKNYAETIDPLA